MQSPKLLVALLSTVAWVPNDLHSQSLSDQEFQKLRDRVQAKIDDLHGKADFPGVSVRFALSDGRSAGVVSGFADVEGKVVLKPSDRLLAGSVGKTFVATVVLQLAEEEIHSTNPNSKHADIARSLSPRAMKNPE